MFRFEHTMEHAKTLFIYSVDGSVRKFQAREVKRDLELFFYSRFKPLIDFINQMKSDFYQSAGTKSPG